MAAPLLVSIGVIGSMVTPGSSIRRLVNFWLPIPGRRRHVRLSQGIHRKRQTNFIPNGPWFPFPGRVVLATKDRIGKDYPILVRELMVHET